jgi:hypothetical protein
MMAFQRRIWNGQAGEDGDNAEDLPPAPPVEASAEEVSEAQRTWQEVLEVLKHQLPSTSYNAWVAGTRLLAVEGGVATTEVTHEQAKAWLDERLKGVIGRELGHGLKAPVGVEFVVG